MPKKVLNYTGQRPMLLALIMTTLTLGLLFSGWLTPTPSRANGNGGGDPPTGEERTNNCPNYVTNIAPNCPSIISHGVLAPVSFCVKQGDPLPDPAYTSGTATAGSVVTTITETCSGSATVSTNLVNYSFTWNYDPSKPAGNLAPGTYVRQAIEYSTSSDTANCSNPSAYTMGTVTWNVHPVNKYCTPNNSRTLSVYFLVSNVGLKLYAHGLTECYTKNFDDCTEKWVLQSSIASLATGTPAFATISWGEEHKYSFESGYTQMGASSGIGNQGASYLQRNAGITVLSQTGLQGTANTTSLIWQGAGGNTPGIITAGGSVTVDIQ